MRNRTFKFSAIVFLITFIVWSGTLSQTFLGEGYFYFESWRGIISPTIGYKALLSYDNFARIMFTIAPLIFKDNLFLYQLFQLLTFSSLTSIFFFIIYKITKDLSSSFLASIFFLSSVTGTFEMIAEGNYDRFVQRIPNFIPALIAFYFLYLFIKSNKKTHLLISILLFCIAMFMAHFTFIMTPLFIIYPLVQILIKKTTTKEIIKKILISITFLTMGILFVYPDPYHQSKSILKFLNSDPKLLEKIIYQIPTVAFPYELIPKTSILLKNLFDIKSIKPPYISSLQILTFILVYMFTRSLYYYYKNDKDKFSIFLTFFGALVSGFVLYFYTDDKLNPFIEFGSGRQYFIFIIYISVLIALSLKYFIKNNSNFKKVTIVLSLFILLWNLNYINKKIYSLEYLVKANRVYTTYIKKISPNFTDSTVIFARSRIHWPNDLIFKFYTPKGARQVTTLSDLKELNLKNYDDVYVFDYDFQTDPSEEPNPQKGIFLDLTNQFRNKSVDLSSW